MAGKKRIYEAAKEFNLSSNALVTILRNLGFDIKSHMSVATDEMLKAVKKKFDAEKEAVKKDIEQKKKAKAAKEPSRKKPPTGKPSTDKPSTGKPQAGRPQTGRPQAGKQPSGQQRTDRRDRPLRGQKRKPEQAGKKDGDRKPPEHPPGKKPEEFKKQVAKLSSALEKGEKQKRRKRDKRKKKDRRVIDQKAVAKSFKATLASMETGKKHKKVKRKYHDDEFTDESMANEIEVNEFMTVAELAGNMGKKPAELVAVLFNMGMVASINQRLDMDSIEMLALEFDFKIKEQAEIGSEAREDESEENLTRRAPVVTVMGHVDHGKTSLLDYIRHTNVVAGEAGAITQHIGAYEVRSDGKKVVFIDTPGHEAFTAMRARGAQITDIVILVVAADDGVMPQTVEAIDHARAANVPIIVAINKIDKEGANIDRIRQELAKMNLIPEEWGGKTIMCEVSAKTGQGIDNLIEMIHLEAEILDLQADPTIRGQGVVIEAKLEKGRGPVSTVIIQTGKMEVGDSVVAGTYYGHIRQMLSDTDEARNKIGPSTPVRITGLNGVPQAGDSIIVVQDDQEARDISSKRSQLKREMEIRSSTSRTTLENLFDQIKDGQVKELRLVIKTDVDGSAEVLSETLSKIVTDEVRTSIIRKGVGAVNESDVLLAAASDAVIIAFNVSPDGRARDAAAREKVEIKQYSIIYEVESDIRKALEGMLSPEISEELVATAEVRQVFKVPRLGSIAGCFVKDGTIKRNNVVHLIRDGIIVYKGEIGSLKRFKDDAKEVAAGFECGVGIENFNDIKVGDILEFFKVVESAKKLEIKGDV